MWKADRTARRQRPINEMAAPQPQTTDKFDAKSITAIAVLLALLLIVLVLSAWVEDDAYITFRSIDNFINGYGLTWNVAERVQSYTHPLWMFLLSAFCFVTREFYYTSIFVSLAITMLTATILAFRLSEGPWTAVLVLLGLTASKPFVDFSTSGLENPLTHLILALFLLAYFRMVDSPRKFLLLSLLAALATVNRMDTILLYFPALTYAFFASPWRKNLWPLLLGFAPFAAWVLFALLYYGYAIPNTAFAKLNAGIAEADLIQQGCLYLQCTINRSPITAVCTLAAILYALGTRSLKMILPATGIALYVAYVIRIGGDYMDGRFFSAPFLLGVILLARHRFRPKLSEGTMIATTIVVLGLAWPNSPVRVWTDYGKGRELYYWQNGISDERAGYYQYTGLLVQKPDVPAPNHPWAELGRKTREEGTRLVRRGGIGFFGLNAGPGVHIVDAHALTDPLLSQLPIMTPKKWRIGHFTRNMPPGYMETLESGQNKIYDSSMAEYYDKLTALTRDDLFSWDRVREIWNFNTGRYDYLIEEYLTQPQRVALRNFSDPRPRGTPYNAGGCFLIKEPGLRVELEAWYNNPAVELSVDSNDEYILRFLADSSLLGVDTLPVKRIPEGGLRVDTVTVPQAAVNRGFNIILIQPQGGDATYSVGHLRLLPDGNSGS